MSVPDEASLRRRLESCGFCSEEFEARFHNPLRSDLGKKKFDLQNLVSSYSRQYKNEADAVAARVKIAALLDEVERLKRELGE